MENKRIMFVGDNFKYYTGFAYVLISLLKRFAETTSSSNICYVSMTNGLPELKDLDKFEEGLSKKLPMMKIYDSNIEDKERIINFNLAITQFKPHIVISLNDIWRLNLISDSPFRSSFFWAAYTNIETPVYPRTIIMSSIITKGARMNIHEILSKADIIIPYTKMGEDFLLSWYDREKISKPVLNGVDINYISKIPEVPKSEAYSPIIPDDAFVFYSMGTNSPRKQMDKVIDAFAEFKRTIKNPDKYYLVIHSGSNIILNGADIAEQVFEYQLQTSVYLTCTDSLSPSDKSQLYKEYKASDCYIGFPGGEGFGYGFAEAIVCEKPVIYINYGGHVEYCKGAGLAVDVLDYNRARNTNIKWASPDIKNAAAQMRKIVSDKGIYNKSVAQTKVLKNEFHWTLLFNKFQSIVETKYQEKELSNIYGMPRRQI